MTEPIGPATRPPDPPIEIDTAEGGPPAAASAPRTAGPPPSMPTPATLQLMSSHSLLPRPSPQCIDRAADLAKGAGGLTVAATALAVSGTAGPVGAFIGASMIFGAVFAQYYNCEVDAAEKRAAAR